MGHFWKKIGEEGVDHVSEILTWSGSGKGLSYAKETMSISSADWVKCTNVTSRQTDDRMVTSIYYHFIITIGANRRNHFSVMLPNKCYFEYMYYIQIAISQWSIDRFGLNLSNWHRFWLRRQYVGTLNTVLWTVRWQQIDWFPSDFVLISWVRVSNFWKLRWCTINDSLCIKAVWPGACLLPDLVQ